MLTYKMHKVSSPEIVEISDTEFIKDESRRQILLKAFSPMLSLCFLGSSIRESLDSFLYEVESSRVKHVGSRNQLTFLPLPTRI